MLSTALLWLTNFVSASFSGHSSTVGTEFILEMQWEEKGVEIENSVLINDYLTTK